MTVNRGKRSVTLDLKTEAGRRALLQLVSDADALIENLRAGAAERLGVDGEALLAHNPSLVHTKITGWGERGPMAELPAVDMLLSAVSGTMLTGAAIGQTHDIGTATLATFGTLAALLHRERGGTGQRVRTSMANHSLMIQLDLVTSASSVPNPPVDPSAPT